MLIHCWKMLSFSKENWGFGGALAAPFEETRRRPCFKTYPKIHEHVFEYYLVM